MSGAITFGATITGGIQDVAGILPLLGTEQCEVHIGSALTKGYLYTAAAPMSIFGSLGVARAGFKTFIASLSGRTWSGAKILANMGFEPKGINLSLVMIDKDDKDGRHLAETRLDELVKELHIDPSRVTVSHKCTRWNVTMILLTAFLSSLSMIPYIHLNHRGNNLTHFSQWTFPILRAVGGFLTASVMQIVLERRIDRLAASHLAKFNKTETPGHTSESPGEIPDNTSNTEHPPVVDVAHGSKGKARSDANTHNTGTGDVEKGLGILDASGPSGDGRPVEGKPGGSIPSQHDNANDRTGILDWVFLVLLFAGVLSSVVGYVGCFSVVQNATSHTGPLSWLCLEAGLSIIRMMLWALNPKGDDAPPLELVLRLDHHAILPTCNLDDAHILQEKILPLTRENHFLNSITLFAGLVERFTHPDLTLYYTLTRKQTVTDPEHSDEAGRRVLYITIFDHKERTTRVYTQDGTTEHFFSTESDAPLIDLKRGLLETTLDKEIVSEDDLITGDPDIRSLLRVHYQSIMDQIHFTIGEMDDTTTPPLPRTYTIENKWTMHTADMLDARKRSRREEAVKQGSRTWGSRVERGRSTEVDQSDPTFARDRLYFEHGHIEEMRRSLDAARGRWIDNYMELVIRETSDWLEGETTAMRRVDGEPVESESESMIEKKAFDHDEQPDVVVQEGLIAERFLMEKLLVYEVEAWESLVWNREKEFMDRSDVPKSEKGRLMKEWRGNCWKRLNTDIRAMDARVQRAKTGINAMASNKLSHTLTFRLQGAHNDIQRDWQRIIERLVDPLTLSDFLPGTRFIEDVEKHVWQAERRSTPALKELASRQHQEMACRLKKELNDVEFRIAQGLDRCDQFFEDEQLLDCKHSRSKYLVLSARFFEAPLDFYSRALKGNNDVIFIRLYCISEEINAWFAETICDMPSVTSISAAFPGLLPPISRDTPLFFDWYHLETFLNNDESLARTRDTYVFMRTGTIAVSFIGPSFGNLTLKLVHRALRPDTTLTVLGTSFTLTIPASITIDDINLRPIGLSFSHLSFKPNTRNNLVLQISDTDYFLQDLKLFNEDGDPHGQPSQHNVPAAELDALGMPDDHASSSFDALHKPDDRELKDPVFQRAGIPAD